MKSSNRPQQYIMTARCMMGIIFGLYSFATLAQAHSPTEQSQGTEDTADTSFQKSAESVTESSSAEMPRSKNQIMKLTDRGLEPPVIRMRKEDSVLFFLNDSTDSLVTLSIDFGNNAIHCGSSLKVDANGKQSTSLPFEPKNFISTCFHESGTYPLTVFGLRPRPAGLTGSIIVE